MGKNNTYTRKDVIIDGHTLHLEFGHERREWKRKYDDAEHWDILFEEICNGALEPDDIITEDMLYWYINGRVCETEIYL